MPDLIVYFLVILLVVILFILGLAGCIFPALPGTPLIFIGILIYGFYDQFKHIQPFIVLIAFLVTLFTMVVDYLSSAYGVKKVRGSRYAVIGSILGSLLGLIMFQFIGMLLGVFLGAFFAELLYAESSNMHSFKVALASLLSFLAGMVLRLFLSFILIIIFILSFF